MNPVLTEALLQVLDWCSSVTTVLETGETCNPEGDPVTAPSTPDKRLGETK